MTAAECIHCRSCGAKSTLRILDLGMQPLANNLLRPGDLPEDEPRFPLHLFVCPQCWLIQIADLVQPVKLFTEYLYFSSFSDSMLAHAKAAAERHAKEFGLGQQSRVVEIASNDGYLLQNFVRLGVPCFGIEPAANVARIAQEKGIETLVEFFDEALGRRLSAEGRAADLILGNNVFAHVPDINGITAGLRNLLKPQGRVVLEFPYAVDMLDKNEFDTIYHEHVFYFTLTALIPLFERHGLTVYRVDRLPIHGGSLRLYACHAGSYPIESSVENLLAEEASRQVACWEFYEGFAARVEQLKENLNRLVKDLNRQGKTVAAYGASAKGSTLLNFVGLNHKDIQFVADRSSYKQGRLTPGTYIPIVAAEELARRIPSHTLLLTWNFATEIMAQQDTYRKAGGKFIIPIPQLAVL